MDMKRRAALTTLAAGLAGCSPLRSDTGATGTPTADRTPTGGTTGTPTPTPDRTFASGESHAGVTVEVRDVLASVVTLDVGSSVHPDVAAFEGAQFLSCAVTGGDEETVSRLDVELDGERLGARQFRHDTSEPSPVAFRVPVRDVDAAAVVWPDEGVRWRVPDGSVADLGARPAFRVRRLGTPDTVAPGESIPVDLAVENVGDRDGRFLAELGTAAISDVGEVTVTVDVDETVERQFAVEPTADTPPGDDDRFRVVLDWGTGRTERDVRVE